jgi:hypothetical protein
MKPLSVIIPREIGLFVVLAAVACRGSPAVSQDKSAAVSPLAAVPDPPAIMYYGADIGQFPPKVREWIVNVAFTKAKMERDSTVDPQLKIWWSDDGNSVLCEASYIVAPGYVGAGTKKTWGTEARYRGPNLERYGQYTKYHTLRFKYDLTREAEYRMAHDPAYAEVIAFAQQLCREIEYDWINFSGYQGPRPVRTPGMRYAVCEGYSNEVLDKALTLKSVKSAEKWSSPGHAWNVLKLVDGRTLYFDLTWFDNEHIDEKTGLIYQTDDYDWENITFNEDVFRYANVGYKGGVFHHAHGIFDLVVRK